MNRTLFPLLLAISGLALACSSGLEGETAENQTNSIQGSHNLRFGFDPGLTLTDGITEYDVTGGILNGGSGIGRPVAFVAFITNARADDGDGQGHALDRSLPAPADAAGTADVFVAAIEADDVDPRSFVYSIAGKMMNPRCVTCHTMNIDPANPGVAGPPTAFQTSRRGHPGPKPPFNTTSDATCSGCHFENWRSPSANFDLRRNTVDRLFQRAMTVLNEPTGQEEHFLTDPRVHWALGDGRLPFGNVADDDQNGVREPEDDDGTIRTVPGGIEDFLARIAAWKASGRKFDSKEAVRDLVLASRAFNGTSAGNGDCSAVRALYVPSPFFTPGVSDPDFEPVGFVRLVYVSDSTDLVGGNTNAVADVMADDIVVFHRRNGTIDLQYDPTGQLLVSAGVFGDGNAASSSPSIGGEEGLLVAFSSEATDLVAGFQDQNGNEPDVYVRDLNGGPVQLVSHVPGNPIQGGNGNSFEPSVASAGNAVAFSSEASNLVAADTNGNQDVFYAMLPALDVSSASVASDGAEGTGGDCGRPSLYLFSGTSDVRVAFESTKTNLVSGTRPGNQDVYLRDTRNGGSTTLVNQLRAPRDLASSRRAAPALTAGASNPALSPDGDAVLFETLATGLDFLRPESANREVDVVLADLALLESDGFVLPYTLSVGADGGAGNGPSHGPRFGSFRSASDAFPMGVALFATAATNLSNSDVPGDANLDGLPDSENLLLMFLREGGRVIADFEASPERQGAGRDVTFVSRSSGKPTQFLWDFGDGTTSTDAQPTHSYAAPGDYTVALSVSGVHGADDRTRDAYVKVLGAVVASFESTKDAAASNVVQDPAADVPSNQPIRGAIDPDQPGSSLTFSFDSAPSQNFPDSFAWEITEIDPLSGDPLGPPEPLGTQPTAEKTLDARGQFEVSLEATGPGGAGSTTGIVEVWNRVEAAFSATTPVAGDAPLSVTFVDETQGDLESLSWRDGANQFSASLGGATQSFSEGVHQVTLVARGKGGDTDASSVLTVTSFGLLTASFSPGVVQATTAGTFQQTFTNNTNEAPGIPLSYGWNFGNGSTSTLKSPGAQSFDGSSQNVVGYTVTLVASTDAVAPSDCTGQTPTSCSEAPPGTVTLFPPLASVSLNVAVNNPTLSKQLTFTPSATGIGSGTSAEFTYFRSAVNGGTANIQLGGTFTDTNPVTFTVSEPGAYVFRVNVRTLGPNSSFQNLGSSNVARTVFASFVDDVFPIMSSNCFSCHGAPASCIGNGNMGFDVNPSAATVYNLTVNVAASHCTGTGCPGMLRFNGSSTNPSDSWIYRKITAAQGTCGVPMPQGSPGLPTALSDVFASFIQGGLPFGQ